MNKKIKNNLGRKIIVASLILILAVFFISCARTNVDTAGTEKTNVAAENKVVKKVATEEGIQNKGTFMDKGTLINRAAINKEAEIEKTENEEEMPVASTIPEGKVGEKINLGGLEVTVSEPEDGEYLLKVLKKGEVVSFETVEKTYKKIYLKLFNPTSEKKSFKPLKLIDNLGNEYKLDSNPDSTVPMQEFGRDLNIYPSTIRKGYLVFLEVDENAEDLELTLELDFGEKTTFEFEN